MFRFLLRHSRKPHNTAVSGKYDHPKPGNLRFPTILPTRWKAPPCGALWPRGGRLRPPLFILYENRTGVRSGKLPQNRGEPPVLIGLVSVPGLRERIAHRADRGLTGAAPGAPRTWAPRFRNSPEGAGCSRCCWSADGRRSGFPGSCTLFG